MERKEKRQQRSRWTTARLRTEKNILLNVMHVFHLSGTNHCENAAAASSSRERHQHNWVGASGWKWCVDVQDSSVVAGEAACTYTHTHTLCVSVCVLWRRAILKQNSVNKNHIVNNIVNYAFVSYTTVTLINHKNIRYKYINSCWKQTRHILNHPAPGPISDWNTETWLLLWLLVAASAGWRNNRPIRTR